MSFTNKVALVTGASSGIGAAIATSFARSGANVIIVGRNETKLKNVSEDCAKSGPKPLVINADITQEEHVKVLVKKTVKKFGKIDILVNNAGIFRLGSIINGHLLQMYDEVMKTNMRAHLHITSEFAKYLIESKGNIINISSIAGFCVPKLAEMTPYFISKAALNHFTKCSALELSKHGVRVNAVCPGVVTTDIVENAGLLKSSELQEEIASALAKYSEDATQAEEIADTVLFLASDKAKSVTGSTFIIDNGLHLSI